MKRTAKRDLSYLVFRMDRLFKNRPSSEEEVAFDVKSLCRMFSEQFIQPMVGDIPLCPIEYVSEEGKMPAGCLARYNPQTKKCEVNLAGIVASLQNRDGISYVDKVCDYFLALSHSMMHYLQYEYAAAMMGTDEKRLAALESAIAGLGGVPVQKIPQSLVEANDEVRQRKLTKQLMLHPEYVDLLSYGGEKVNYQKVIERLNSNLPSERSAAAGAQTIFGSFIDAISQHITETNVTENAILARARTIQRSEQTKTARLQEGSKKILDKIGIENEK